MAKKFDIKKKNLNKNIFLTAILIIPVMNFLIYYVAVNFNTIFLAFQRYDLNEGKYFFLTAEDGGLLRNFKSFLDDISGNLQLKYVVPNSFMLYAIGLFISLPLHIFVAFFIYKKVWGSKFFGIMLYLPQMISSIVMTILFRYFADQAIPNIIAQLGYPKPNFFLPENVFKTIIIYNLWFGMGSGIIVFTGAMSRIPDELIEVGDLEGISLIKEFFMITVPLIWPTLSVFFITGISGLFTNQGNIYTFYGESAPSSLYTFGYYLFVQVIGTNATLSKYPYASAAGMLFSLIAIPLTLLVKYLLEKYGPEAEF